MSQERVSWEYLPKTKIMLVLGQHLVSSGSEYSVKTGEMDTFSKFNLSLADLAEVIDKALNEPSEKLVHQDPIDVEDELDRQIHAGLDRGEG